MAELPAMPLYTDAYLGDTTHLTTLEHGAYLLLLMAMWRGGGSLPDDDAKLARYARLTPGQWKRIAPTLREFFNVEDGRLVQGRLTDEMVFVRQKSKSQSEKARAKWRKHKGLDDAAAPAGQCRTDAPTPTPTPTVVDSSDPTDLQNLPPHTPQGGAARRSSKKGLEKYPPAFERLWDTRPRIPTRSGLGTRCVKAEAYAEWRQFDAERQEGMQIAAEDERYLAARGQFDFREAKALQRWIKHRVFDRYVTYNDEVEHGVQEGRQPDDGRGTAGEARPADEGDLLGRGGGVHEGPGHDADARQPGAGGHPVLRRLDRVPDAGAGGEVVPCESADQRAVRGGWRDAMVGAGAVPVADDGRGPVHAAQARLH